MILTGEVEYSGKTSPTGGMILTGKAEYLGKISPTGGMILTGEAKYLGKISPTGGMILTGEAEYSGKNLSHYYFNLGLYPSIRNERSATNRLVAVLGQLDIVYFTYLYGFKN
jgi:hypothetical protein